MLVVEAFVLAECVEQMCLVADQGPVEVFGSAGADPTFHGRVHPRHTDAGCDGRDPAVGKDGVNGGGVFAVAVTDQVPHSGGAGVLEVHDEVSGLLGGPCSVGRAVAPRMRMRRVVCSMTARTNSLVPIRVRVSKKSAARMACAWLRRKVAQVWWSRRGAGSMPLDLRISHTVDGATLIARTASSPWIRR